MNRRAPARPVSGDDLELVAGGLTFPTSLAFDDDGVAHVAESGLPFGGAPPGGTVLRLGERGARQDIAVGLRAPVNGLTWHRGSFYVAEGGHPARLFRLQPDGTQETLLTGFPGPGNYQLNTAVVGPDERLYFSQGAMTNLGVVGLDAYEIGWLRRLPHGHDVPGYPITLAGQDAVTPDRTATAPGARAVTGAFVPFGESTRPGQPVAAGLPATASLMRCALDGSGLELVGWCLRNAYVIGFLDDGRLIAVDHGADDRGSRPVGGASGRPLRGPRGCLVRVARLHRRPAGHRPALPAGARRSAVVRPRRPRRPAQAVTTAPGVPTGTSRR